MVGLRYQVVQPAQRRCKDQKVSFLGQKDVKPAGDGLKSKPTSRACFSKRNSTSEHTLLVALFSTVLAGLGWFRNIGGTE